ncbi:2881_t:CDS:2, partial [Entrophospora sp. SA101]
MISLTITFLSFWFILHLITYFLQQKLKQPLANSVRSAAHSTPLPRFRSQKNYTVIHSKPFSIRLTTTILNPVFTSIAKKTPRFWRIWFNIGAFVGICVMIIGVGVIMVASWKLLIELFSNVVLDTDISST